MGTSGVEAHQAEPSDPATINPGKWMKRKEAARFLSNRGCGVTATMLARWAVNNNAGKGPPFSKIRRTVSYAESDLIAWANAHLRRVR